MELIYIGLFLFVGFILIGISVPKLKGSGRVKYKENIPKKRIVGKEHCEKIVGYGSHKPTGIYNVDPFPVEFYNRCLNCCTVWEKRTRYVTSVSGNITFYEYCSECKEKRGGMKPPQE